jgi:hypothetical protein
VEKGDAPADHAINVGWRLLRFVAHRLPSCHGIFGNDGTRRIAGANAPMTNCDGVLRKKAIA